MASWLVASVAFAQSPLEIVLTTELDRAAAALATRDEPPHYVSLELEDWEQITVSARDGTLGTSNERRVRFLDVDLRTGTPELDSTHPLRGFSVLADKDRDAVQVPLTDGYALRHAVNRELDANYRQAAERIVVLRANRDVKVEEEDPAPDFEPRPPVVDRSEPGALVVDRAQWEQWLVELSNRIERAPEVHQGVVSLQADRVVETFVDTEGTRLVHGRRHARLSVMLSSVALDGDEVNVFDAIDVHDPASLPDRAEIERRVDAAVATLRARLTAPRADPYSGPVLLSGRATGVFFHEVLGHRVEGHRQKRDDEGKTFADQVGQLVLPKFVDVVDDPTLQRFGDTDLNGFYTYDDEGVPAQRVSIVDDGRFVGFLMGRSPIPGFPHSNGHGRRSAGNAAEARMGNTLVTTTSPTPAAELRKLLVAQAKAQGLPYGYLIDEIEGGFTMTGRVTPNAFNVRASSTWRVYVDGRPDELVRGIDLVGTPLVAFHNLVATGDDPQVFDGVCGSDSGWVPVSAVAPSVLFSRLEFQLKEKGEERPPLLAKPTSRDDGAAEAR
ncbi:MAG: TldD/PmbA family protein [Myxococcota bacterium]